MVSDCLTLSHVNRHYGIRHIPLENRFGQGRSGQSCSPLSRAARCMPSMSLPCSPRSREARTDSTPPSTPSCAPTSLQHASQLILNSTLSQGIAFSLVMLQICFYVSSSAFSRNDAHPSSHAWRNLATPADSNTGYRGPRYAVDTGGSARNEANSYAYVDA